MMRQHGYYLRTNKHFFPKRTVDLEKTGHYANDAMIQENHVILE